MGGLLLKLPEIDIPVVNFDPESEKTTAVKNLHSLWDSGVGAFAQVPYRKLVNQKDLDKLTPQAEVEYAARNARELADLVNSAAKKGADEDPDLETWAAEGIQVGLSAVYSGLDTSLEKFPFAGRFLNKQEYFSKGQAACRYQMALGGYHLGQVLNAIFDPDHASKSYVKFVNGL